MNNTPAQRAAEKINLKFRLMDEFPKLSEKVILEIIAEIIEAEYSQWQPMETAPRAGTPVLLLMKGAEELPERSDGLADIQFVGKNRGDLSEWGFAAPVGYGGFPDEWLVGWKPLSPKAKESE